MDLDKIRGVVLPKPEMHGAGARGSVSNGRGDVVVLRAALRHHFNARADRVAIALRALQFQLQPMVSAGAAIHPDFSGRTERDDHHIEAPVAVEVAHGRAAMACVGCAVNPASAVRGANFMPPKFRKTQLCCATRDESRPAAIARDRARRRCPSTRRCRNRRSLASSRTWAAHRAHLTLGSDFDKVALSRIFGNRKSFVVESHEADVRIAIVVDIAEIHAHA